MPVSSPLSDPEIDELDDDFFSSDSDAEQPDGSDRNALQAYIRNLTKGELSRPTHKVMDCGLLYRKIKRNEIDLDPPYQREVVWSLQKMTGLIQSIMLKFYVPALIFTHNNIRQMDEVLVCIDGKQRCTSIVRFMDGEIPFISPGTGEKLWFQDNNETPAVGKKKKKKKLLPEPLKRHFEGVEIQAVSYEELELDQQRDIFQRVQLGVALSAAEKLQALSSPWAIYSSKLEAEYIKPPQHLGDLLDWDVKRGKSFSNTAAFLYLVHCQYNGREGTTPTQMTLKSFFKDTSPPEKGLQQDIEIALGIWIYIAIHHYDDAFSTTSRRVSPVESWFIPYLIYMNMSRFSLVGLASAIGSMRAEVHSKFAGSVMANSRIVAFLKDFVHKTSPKKGTSKCARDEWLEIHGVGLDGDESRRKRRKAVK